MRPIMFIRYLANWIQTTKGWKVFIIIGGLLVIFGEGADLILGGQFNLWVQILIALLLAALLIYTMNKK